MDLDLSIFNKLLTSLDIKKEDPHLVALSGGPDSVFLVHAFLKLGIKPILLYVNYHDSEFVKQEEKIIYDLKDEYSLQLIKMDTEISKDVNFEDTARKIRYNFFEKQAKTFNTKYVFVAHQKDDLFETYLLQKERSNFVSHYGLKEVSLFNEHLTIVRPLLGYTKKELIDFLNENHIPFFDDPTNYNTHRQRNALRENRKFKNWDESSLLKDIETDNLKLKVIQEKISKLLENVHIQITEYNALTKEEKLRLLFEFIKKQSLINDAKLLVSKTHLVFERLKGNSCFAESLTDEKVFYRDYEEIFIAGKLVSKYSYEIKDVKSYIFNELEIDLTNPSSFNIKQFPIYITTPKKGDRISTNIITKDVFSFLKKQKVPNYLWDIYPVIKNNKGQIIYVPFYCDIKNKKIPLTLKLISD